MTTATIPRWAKISAYLIPFLVLPSAIWRLSYIVGVWIDGPGPCDTEKLGEGLYIASLSFLSMGFALLAVGLVRPWGEVFLGRPVPTRAVAIAMTAGATLITLIVSYYVLNQLFGFVEGLTKPLPAGCEPPGDGVLVLYAPMLVWPPLLYAVTYQYWLRTR
jgi:hypothetical protein